MKALYGSLIGVVTVLMLLPLALAGPPSWDDQIDKPSVFPSWDDQINNPSRFKVLKEFDGEAVLDRETGLVWQQSPGTFPKDWYGAVKECYLKSVGGRKGWRLPTVEELASLLDQRQSVPGISHLPYGHPFSDAASDYYWSSTTYVNNPVNPGIPPQAWVVNFYGGGVDWNVKSASSPIWCVRGGHGYDGY